MSDASWALVRTMMPPFSSSAIKPASRDLIASRSSGWSMRCETPMYFSVAASVPAGGRYTKLRPAMLSCVVNLAPLVPSGSFKTCTSKVCPSKSSFSICACGLFWVISATCIKAVRSRPTSINADCMPGKTRTTLAK